MIRLDRVSKTYRTHGGARCVLSGVSLCLARGEKLGVMGCNGAGKSTLIRLIAGAERPSTGTIVRTMSVSWPLAFGGGFQTGLTGRDNVRFVARLYGAPIAATIAAVEQFAELGPWLDEPVRSYSTGMRARLAFALSISIAFDCVLIDEVHAVGDARFRERCEAELFGARGDRAMVITSHDSAIIARHCTRFAVIADRRLHTFDNFAAAHAFHTDALGAFPAPPPGETDDERNAACPA